MSTVTIPTAAELAAAYEAAVQAEQSDLLDFGEGAVLRSLQSGSTVMASEIIRSAMIAAQSAIPTLAALTATRDVLETAITGQGGPAANDASAAVVDGKLTRGATYLTPYTLTAGTQWSGVGPNGERVTFEVDADAVLGVTPGDTATFTATCTETGRDGNVPDDTLDDLDGVDSDITVSQEGRATGGSADETREAYLARWFLYLAARAGAGTPEWIKDRVLAIPGVTYCTVDESNIANAGGYVSVYIGDPDAAASSTQVETVEASLTAADGHAAGIEYRVFASVREEIAFAVELKVKAGSGIDEATVKAAVIAYLDTVQPGATHYASGLETALHRIDFDNVLSADQTTPAARETTPTSAFNAIRTADNGSQITVTITEVA